MVSSTPRPHFTPGKEPVPTVQEAGWAPGPVGTGGKSRPTGVRSPDRPARSSVALPTELPGPHKASITEERHKKIYIFKKLSFLLQIKYPSYQNSNDVILTAQIFNLQ